MARSRTKSPAPARDTSATAAARIQVLASAEQAQILADAAKAAGVDRSSWMLAHALKAAGAAATAHAPLLVGGAVADRLRAAAERQGVTPEKLVEQLLIAAA